MTKKELRKRLAAAKRRHKELDRLLIAAGEREQQAHWFYQQWRDQAETYKAERDQARASLPEVSDHRLVPAPISVIWAEGLGSRDMDIHLARVVNPALTSHYSAPREVNYCNHESVNSDPVRGAQCNLCGERMPYPSKWSQEIPNPDEETPEEPELLPHDRWWSRIFP